MSFISRYFNLLIAIIICLLSAIALIINHYVTKFPGNNYFPPGAIVITAILFFMLLGTYLLFDKESPYFKMMQELVYFFLVMSVIAFATNAVQFAPFNPIDKQLIAVDHVLGIHLEKIVAWVINKPWLRIILAAIYDSLPYQMSYLPFIFIFARKFSYLREYYAFLLMTTLIGFLFYYFWPTIGPASAIGSPYFTPLQYATGVKFAEIHHHIPPSTIEGGLIAMPSFHVIWALLCLNLSRCRPIFFRLLLPINLLLAASCVLLGWHYFIDVLGSFVVLLIAYYLIKKFSVILGFVALRGDPSLRSG